MSIFSSRRQFLKSLGLAAGAAAAGNVLPGQALEIPAGDSLWKSGAQASPRPSGSMYMGASRLPGWPASGLPSSAWAAAAFPIWLKCA
ncbi:twin-arginine translocation signal domain-containing protein [Akkermansia massiliensis]